LSFGGLLKNVLSDGIGPPPQRIVDELATMSGIAGDRVGMQASWLVLKSNAKRLGITPEFENTSLKWIIKAIITMHNVDCINKRINK
jgi:hypothetical protein